MSDLAAAPARRLAQQQRVLPACRALAHQGGVLEATGPCLHQDIDAQLQVFSRLPSLPPCSHSNRSLCCDCTHSKVCRLAVAWPCAGSTRYGPNLQLVRLVRLICNLPTGGAIGGVATGSRRALKLHLTVASRYFGNSTIRNARCS